MGRVLVQLFAVPQKISASVSQTVAFDRMPQNTLHLVAVKEKAADVVVQSRPKR
jgi:hypothetical protein